MSFFIQLQESLFLVLCELVSVIYIIVIHICYILLPSCSGFHVTLYVWLKILYSKICQVISLNNYSLVWHHMTSLNAFHIGSGNDLLPVLTARPCLKQPWFIIYLTLVNKFQWNVNQNAIISIQWNAHDNAVCTISDIMCRPQYVKIVMCEPHVFLS